MYCLRSCVWELTRACTMRCIHCGSQAGDSRKEELDEQEAFEIADQLIDLGCRRITLIGGEVTLCPHWARLARHFVDSGVTCCIVTNGYHKTRKDYEDFISSRIVSVSLSVDGMERLHNQIRGRADAFAEADLFCRQMGKTSVPLTVVTTITRDCVRELGSLYHWLAERGVQVWQWQQIAPMGNARGHESLLLRPDDVRQVFRQYQEFTSHGNGPQIVLADNLGYYVEQNGELLHPFQGCAAGLSTVGIDSVGNVRGCAALSDECFIEGNLRQTTLRAIWESPDSFSYNRKFTPELLNGKCRRCVKGSICAGGCRSFNASHGALYENPNCVTAICVDDWRSENGDEAMPKRALIQR